MSIIHFWNGNKSNIRQLYERILIHRVIEAAGKLGANTQIIEDKTDYPSAEDEGNIFTKNTDVCVTVAGNSKFSEEHYIPVHHPLMSGLLGHRLLVIRQSDTDAFSRIKTSAQLRQKTAGIAATWADADLLRDNKFAVSERGSMEDLLPRLQSGECDYVPLGANEVHGFLADYANNCQQLTIEQTLRLYYPYALVFYVNPHQPELAEILTKGLHSLAASGEHQLLFNDFFIQALITVRLNVRDEISLYNKALPDKMRDAMAKEKSKLLNMLDEKCAEQIIHSLP